MLHYLLTYVCMCGFAVFSHPADSREVRRGEKVKADGLHDPGHPDIPAKEGKMADNGIHEIPTKDTEGANASGGDIYTRLRAFDETNTQSINTRSLYHPQAVSRTRSALR